MDEIEVTIPAASYLEVDDRLLPTRISPVAGTENDLRARTALGPKNLDTAMTDLARDADGRWRATLRLGERFAEAVGRRDDELAAGLHRRSVPRLVARGGADDLWAGRVQSRTDS